MEAGRKIFAAEPWIRATDLRLVGAPSWREVDDISSGVVGRRCVALPSVRVGLCWMLEHRGYARHRDHILVPRFLGRCILNALGRHALPVETPTPETRIALVVDQFGMRQKLAAMRPRFDREGWAYVEDSPYGLGEDESPGDDSLGRLIGLGKPLPVVQGALLVSADESLNRFMLAKREERSAWSWLVWLTMLALRRRHVGPYAHAADAAYEMYVAARGGNAWLRGNIAAVLACFEVFARESGARLAAAADALGTHVLAPDQARVGYLLPFLPGDGLDAARAVFRRCGFDDAPLHVDLARNLLAPQYVKCLMIPLNPRVPRPAFDSLIAALGALVGASERA